MKRIAVGIIVAMMALGAVYGAAATLGVGGVDQMQSQTSTTSISTGPTPTCTMVGIGCTVQ